MPHEVLDGLHLKYRFSVVRFKWELYPDIKCSSMMFVIDYTHIHLHSQQCCNSNNVHSPKHDTNKQILFGPTLSKWYLLCVVFNIDAKYLGCNFKEAIFVCVNTIYSCHYWYTINYVTTVTQKWWQRILVSFINNQFHKHAIDDYTCVLPDI